MITYRNLDKIFIFFLFLVGALNICQICFFTNPMEVKDIDYRENIINSDLSFNALTGKSLYLRPFELKGDVFLISDQIDIRPVELRPDRLLGKPRFMIKLKNMQDFRYVEEDEILYLNFLENGNFEFSDEKTPFIIQVKKIDKNNLGINLRADLRSLNIDNDINESFVISGSEDSLSNNDSSLEFKLLSDAKWWGIDQFFLIHDSQNVKAKKQRLEIDKNIFYVEKNDILIFKDKWQIPSLMEETNKYPIARIRYFDSQNMEIEGWDVTGDHKFLFVVPFIKDQSFAALDNFITSARKRTRTHISCLLNQQRVVLKEKDILLKKDNRWKRIKKDVDLNEIKYDSLFYFQKIEDRQSQKYLIGYVFDPMRTNFQKIEIPIFAFSNLQRLKKGNNQ